MRSPRSNNDTSRMGYTSIEEGESSKSVEERSKNGKNSKPTCHNYGKKGHTTYVCRRKIVNYNVKQKIMGHYHMCKKKVIRHMNSKPRPCTLKDLKDAIITIKIMDIDLLNADPNPIGHQTSIQK